MQRANDCHAIAKRNTGSFLFLHIVKILFFSNCLTQSHFLQIVKPTHFFCKCHCLPLFPNWCTVLSNYRILQFQHLSFSLQALNGFLMILDCQGELFFATHSIETYLGFHQVRKNLIMCNKKQSVTKIGNGGGIPGQAVSHWTLVDQVV